MKRIGRHKRKKQNEILIIGSISLLLFLCAGYAAFSTNLSITAKGNIKEKSRVIQSWNETSQTDFHSDFYKENIVSVTFLDNANVPSNATESWNVSEDQKHGGVMAWVIPSSEDNTKYDLYMGARGGVIANEDSSWLFAHFTDVTEINFNNNYDTSNALKTAKMFYQCINLSTINVSSFDTRNVTNMDSMFAMYNNVNGVPVENKLTNIIFGDNFSVENVTIMSQLFAGCSKLTTIDVSDWDTSNVIDMSSVFAYCQSLTSLDLSKWDTSNAGTMSWLFKGCTNLITINLDNFNTSKVTGMYQMFCECINLTNLNLCSFNTKSVTNMYQMFYHTASLKQIRVGFNWSMDKVTNSSQMFSYSGVSSVTTGQC